MSRHAGMRLAVRAASSTSAGAAAVKLKVGDSLRSARRRFTAEDVAAYAAVTGDRNPVHLDDAFACTWFTRGRVVQGALVASILPRLIASRFPGAVYSRQSLGFCAPVYVGDETAAEVQALSISTVGDRRLVKFGTKCCKFEDCDDGDEAEVLTVQGEAMVFLPTLHLSPEEAPEYSTCMAVGFTYPTKPNPWRQALVDKSAVNASSVDAGI